MPVDLLDVMAATCSATDPALLPGETLAGKYRIERVLGRGGMGVVLSARNALLGERVAIKVLARGATPASTSRLLMEARATARLKSDHVVRIFDAGHTETGDPYLVMEHLEGQNLSELLAQHGPPPFGDAARWVLELCEALAEAHAHGIIHRDIKPANVFLERRPDGSQRIKVLDFGIAKLPQAESLLDTTRPIGSPIYMAPEQLVGGADLDARADVWGSGCVLYQLLTGRAPFDASSVLELASKLRSGSYARAAELRPELPTELSSVVDRCLAPERAQRFASVLALARALRPFVKRAGGDALERMQRIGDARTDAEAHADFEDGAPPGVEGAATLSTPALSESRFTAGARARATPAQRYAALAGIALVLLGGSWLGRHAVERRAVASPALALTAGGAPAAEGALRSPEARPPVAGGSLAPPAVLSASMTAPEASAGGAAARATSAATVTAHAASAAGPAQPARRASLRRPSPAAARAPAAAPSGRDAPATASARDVPATASPHDIAAPPPPGPLPVAPRPVPGPLPIDREAPW